MKKKHLFSLLIAVIFLSAAPLFPLRAASIPKRAAIPVPVPPGAQITTRWQVFLDPGQTVTRSAIRWAVGKFHSYRASDAFTSSSQPTGGGNWQGRFCIPPDWQGREDVDFINSGAWALIDNWQNIYQTLPTIIPQATYDNVGGEGVQNEIVNNHPYEARYPGGSRNWRYFGGEDKKTAHLIDNAFSSAVMQRQREGIEKYQITNWGVFKARYQINFYLAEFSANGPGERVFDILANGRPVDLIINDDQTRLSTGIDPYKLAGGRFKQVKISFIANSDTDTNLNITFVAKTQLRPILNAADIVALAAINSPCNGQTPSPSPTPVPTATINPTSPPATAVPTEGDIQCSCDNADGLAAKQGGDFDCSGTVDIGDFTLWTIKYVQGGTGGESLSCSSSKLPIDDFNAWLTGYLNKTQS